MKKNATEFGKPVEYAIPPRRIKIEVRNSGCVCQNCANVGKVFILHYNETDYETPKGNIGSKRYAKKVELWLCEDCFQEMFNAMKKELEK